MSVTWPECAFSFVTSSSPDLASKMATLPDSWPVMIVCERGANAATVALEPMGLNSTIGSDGSVGEAAGEQKSTAERRVRVRARERTVAEHRVVGGGARGKGRRQAVSKGRAGRPLNETVGRTVCRRGPVDLVDSDGSLVSRTLLGDGQEQTVVLAESTQPDRDETADEVSSVALVR